MSSKHTLKLQDLPEFYVLVDTQRKDLEESSLAGSSTAHLAQSERLRHLKKKIAAQSKVVKRTVSDKFYDDLRKAQRPLYSRGHEVHRAGDQLPFRAYGMSPIASRGVSSTNRMATRPATRDGGSSSSRGGGGSSSSREAGMYSRPVSPAYTSGGMLMTPNISSRTSTPLQAISYHAPSVLLARPTSSGYYPDDPENILEDTRMRGVSGFANRVSVVWCVCVLLF